MKFTVLEIVQEVLNDIDGDEVNSLDDTAESQQIAYILRSTYLAMLSNRNWPHTRRLVSAVESGVLDQPIKLRIEDEVKELVLLNYNKSKLGEDRKRYEKVTYMDPDNFLRLSNSRDSESANVDVILEDSGVELMIYNDRHPEYFTTFDDIDLVFDSYDSSIESRLSPLRVQAIAYVIPKFYVEDDFIPDLPDEAFPALMEECKSKASFKLRQMVDQKSEQESQKQQRWLSRKARRVAGGVTYPGYGRGHFTGSRSMFEKNNK